MIIKKMSKKGAVLARLAVIIFLAGLFSVFNPAKALADTCRGVGIGGAGIPDPNSSICPNDWIVTKDTQNQLVTSCTDARKCEYTCNNGYIFVNHFGVLSCSPVDCNSGTSCDTMWNDNGTNKYCRKMGDYSNSSNVAWNWVPAQVCNSHNFGQTYQCGTSTGSPERGYCGIKSDETFDWVNSGSASCPYSISVNRNQSEYQLTASCAANDTGCQTASVSVKVTSSNNVTGPNAVAVAKNLYAARFWNDPINHPSQICFLTYSDLKMTEMSPTWWLSGSTFTWHDYRDGTKTTLPIDNELCTTECSGVPGNYRDIYYISNFFRADNYFTINCTPPTTIIPPAYVCTPGQWDVVNCRACNASGQWTADCTDWGTGADVPAWCACELKCTGKNSNPDCAAPPINPPSTPTISASCPSPGTAGHVEWSASAGATYYAFRLNNYTLSGDWNDACQPAYEGDICENINAPSISRDFEGSPGSFYDAWVHACNSAGCSPAVAVQDFSCLQPLPPCVCNPPAQSCATPSGNGICTVGIPSSVSESGSGNNVKFNWTCGGPTCITSPPCQSDKGNPGISEGSPLCGSLSGCSPACGGGTKTQTCQNHDCSFNTRSISCNSQPCPPGYREVTPW